MSFDRVHIPHAGDRGNPALQRTKPLVFRDRLLVPALGLEDPSQVQVGSG